MTLNEHINVDTELNQYADKFYPDEGYALWQDNEEGNLDENGNPHQYYLQINVLKRNSETTAPHIWAKLIDDTMEVFGKTNPDEPVLMAAKDRAMSLSSEDTEAASEESHTYIDENGVERPKRGVY